MTNTRLYNIYHAMRARCSNPNDSAYRYYGGSGITVCAQWVEDFTSFSQWAHSNGYNDSLQIDRIDNTQGYSPENCRWVTSKVNNNNRRDNNRITYNGETHTLQEWSEILSIPRNRLSDRFRRGWTIEQALTLPKRTNQYK